MTLEQLRIFIAVAEREHITKAAEVLNLTQSAVSSAVASLEARYAVALFNRVGRGIELTEAGRVFLEEARAIQGRVAMTKRILAEISGLERGALTIYASQTIASYWLPTKLVQFRKAHPKIAITLQAANTQQVARAVQEGLADIGFAEGAVNNEELVQQTIARDRVVIVVAPSHPWSQGQELSITDLKSAEWVLREPGSGTRAEFEEAIKKLGLAIADLNVVLEVPSNEAARLAVEEGAGATAISELAAGPGLLFARIKVANFDMPLRRLTTLRHRDRYLSKAGEALLHFIKP